MRTAGMMGSLALVLGAVTPSYANVQPAMAGHPWTGGGHWQEVDTCLQNTSWDVVTNTCSGAPHVLVIPMQVEPNTRVHAFERVKGNGTSASTTFCQALAIAADNSRFDASQQLATISFTSVSIDLGSFNVPAQGAAHFECSIGSGGAVINVELQ